MRGREEPGEVPYRAAAALTRPPAGRAANSGIVPPYVKRGDAGHCPAAGSVASFATMEMQGLTQPQVAAALGVSPTTVKRALAKALHAAGGDALAVDGVVAGQSFSARRAVARGGEPWRFAVSGLDERATRAAPAADPATATTARPAEQANPSDEAEQIAWLRAEIERRDAALEREQRANADLRHLLLTLGGDPERDEPRGTADADRAHAPASAPPALATIERAAKDAGIGKKQRRALLDRLAEQAFHPTPAT